MGNKPTYMDYTQSHLYSPYGPSVRPRGYEESFIPMPMTMKKTLLEGRKFRHVNPFTDHEEDVGVGVGRQEAEELDNDIVSPGSQGTLDTEEAGRDQSGEEREKRQVEPVVTVLNVAKVQHSSSRVLLEKARRKSSCGSHGEKHGTTKSLQKSPALTNRRYSLIDMRTGLKKSQFTLELEERLRQSKLELGFDSDLNEWKEFSYRMENPEIGKRAESLQKENLKFGEGNVGKGLEKVCLKDPLQYCAHNCQILGLCSVRRPELFSVVDHPPKDNIAATYNQVQSILKGDLDHHKKDGCNCDHCTLAYLTELGFSSQERTGRHCGSARRGSTAKNTPRSCRRIGIVGKEKSIEITVSERPSTVGSFDETLEENYSHSNLSMESFDGDTTNRRIKRMFKKNNVAIQEMFCDEKENQDVPPEINNGCTENVFKTSGCFRTGNRSEEILQVQTVQKRGPVASRRQRSSSSTLNASGCSSLSSVLSYKRVRQIFQTIIERNRSRRRPRKNIHKFRELEELGLGEVKNNRWYPSDSKTFSIWTGLHQSVHGVQAEFRKFPRAPYLRRLD